MKFACNAIRVGGLIAVMAVVPSAWSAELTITPSTVPNVSLLSFDSAKVDSRLLELFKERGTEWAYFRSYVLVISNESSKRIKALTIAWITTDSAGKDKTAYTSANRYFLSQNPPFVMETASQLLLTPSNNVAVPSAGVRATIPTPPRPLIEELVRATKISVEIDTVIFEDGQVWGPDRSRTVRNLEVRESAARSFARRARDIVGAGGDIGAFLAGLAALSPVLQAEGDWQAQVSASIKERESDLPNFWMARMARASQQSAAPMQAIDLIDRIPVLPKFFREAAKP